ncbi:MAG TPA: ECF-type sigma factor [Gemmatimonadota bacterium]|nr:ECF-type sigma factor [Gemmatimonadota bacterium]
MDSPRRSSEERDAPSGSGREEITRLLSAWSEGDGDAPEGLLELVYRDLKRIAHNRLELEREGHTLRTTALVHEAYLRLAGTEELEWRDRAHFFAVASRVMRHVLVDHARTRNAAELGGGRVELTLTPDAATAEVPVLEVLALEEALSRLEDRSERLARVVECRFYGGMSVRDTAAVLDVSPRTVERDWRRLRRWRPARRDVTGHHDAEVLPCSHAPAGPSRSPSLSSASPRAGSPGPRPSGSPRPSRPGGRPAVGGAAARAGRSGTTTWCAWPATAAAPRGSTTSA